MEHARLDCEDCFKLRSRSQCQAAHLSLLDLPTRVLKVSCCSYAVYCSIHSTYVCYSGEIAWLRGNGQRRNWLDSLPWRVDTTQRPLLSPREGRSLAAYIKMNYQWPGQRPGASWQTEVAASHRAYDHYGASFANASAPIMMAHRPAKSVGTIKAGNLRRHLRSRGDKSLTVPCHQ